MKLPRDLSGSELVKALCKHYGYVRIHQEGSHIILQAERPIPFDYLAGPEIDAPSYASL